MSRKPNLVRDELEKLDLFWNQSDRTWGDRHDEKRDDNYAVAVGLRREAAVGSDGRLL